MKRLGILLIAALGVAGVLRADDEDEKEVDPVSLKGYLKQIRDSEAHNRATAAFALGDLPSPPAALHDPDELVRRDAIDILRNMEPLPPEAVGAVKEALKDRDSIVRDRATIALSHAGGSMSASEKAATFLPRIRDGDSAVRASSAEGLGQIGPVTPETVPALREAWQKKDDKAHSAIGSALEKLGEKLQE